MVTFRGHLIYRLQYLRDYRLAKCTYYSLHNFNYLCTVLANSLSLFFIMPMASAARAIDKANTARMVSMVLFSSWLQCKSFTVKSILKRFSKAVPRRNTICRQADGLKHSQKNMPTSDVCSELWQAVMMMMLLLTAQKRTDTSQIAYDYCIAGRYTVFGRYETPTPIVMWPDGQLEILS